MDIEKAIFSKIGKENLKNIEYIELNKSKIYLLSIKHDAVPFESMKEFSKMLHNIFKNKGIETIIVPENYIDIYELEKLNEVN